MSVQNEPLVSQSYTPGHVVYVSGADGPANRTTTVVIAPREADGKQATSSASAVMVRLDATDGSLSIQRLPVEKVFT